MLPKIVVARVVGETITLVRGAIILIHKLKTNILIPIMAVFLALICLFVFNAQDWQRVSAEQVQNEIVATSEADSWVDEDFYITFAFFMIVTENELFIGMNFTWQNGRQLAGISNNGGASNYISYQYDYAGQRTSKTINGVTTYYYWEGNKLLAEYKQGVLTWFYYDESGICGMNYAGADYYFQKNILGDVLVIYNTAGQLVCSYSYDAWGNTTWSNNTAVSNSASVMHSNPWRYRGYYFDGETGFYYTSSRYYDPQIGRFINADEPTMLFITATMPGGANLYAYCLNNPIMLTDSTGMFIDQWWGKALTIGFGVINPVYGIAMLVGGGISALSGGDFWDGAGWGMAAGLMVGAVAATVFSFGTAGALSAAMMGAGIGIISGMAGSVIAQGGFGNLDPWRLAGAGMIGGAIGAVAGVAGFYGAAMGKLAGAQLGMNMAHARHLGTGFNILGKLGINVTAASKILIGAGGVMGGAIGGIGGGAGANMLANTFIKRDYDPRINASMGVFLRVFKWLR